MATDLGDVVPLAVTVKDSSGTAANTTTVSCTITLPDLTTASASVSNPSTGSYTATYTPTQVGLHRVRWVGTGTIVASYTDDFTVDDATLPSIVGLSELKTHLNITSTSSDEELRDTLADASAAAEQFCNRALSPRAVIETYDGGSSAIRLRSPAALSITSVTDSGTTLAATAYRLRSGVVLERLFGNELGYWTTGVDTVSVTYIVGVAGRELAAARRGVLGIAKHLWDTQRGSMTIGNQMDEQWLPGMGFSIPNRAAQLLEPLRLVGNG